LKRKEIERERKKRAVKKRLVVGVKGTMKRAKAR
jgi:hypothetical protein